MLEVCPSIIFKYPQELDKNPEFAPPGTEPLTQRKPRHDTDAAGCNWFGRLADCFQGSEHGACHRLERRSAEEGRIAGGDDRGLIAGKKCSALCFNLDFDIHLEHLYLRCFLETLQLEVPNFPQMSGLISAAEMMLKASASVSLHNLVHENTKCCRSQSGRAQPNSIQLWFRAHQAVMIGKEGAD